MKPECLLVDGYNIIFAWAELKELLEIDLSAARDRLIETLRNYQGMKHNIIIVVFDAHKVPGNPGSVEKHHNIYVVYTKEAETADHYIEKTATVLTKDYQVKVATSDQLEQVIILGRGAIRISARELYLDIQEAEQKLRARYIEAYKPKENLLTAHLNPEVLEWFEKMRRK